MKILADRIRAEGKVYPGHVLKVDSFINHQIDPTLVRQMAQEIHRLFPDPGVTKILTVEASGIAIAIAVAMEYNVPMLFAKKSRTSNVAQDVYSATVHSYTHNNDYNMIAEKQFLLPTDRVLIVDDFLANGQAILGLAALCEQAGATVAGAAVAVEKAFQSGHGILQERGIRVEALASVLSMTDDSLVLSE